MGRCWSLEVTTHAIRLARAERTAPGARPPRPVTLRPCRNGPHGARGQRRAPGGGPRPWRHRPGEGTCESVAEFEPGYICGCGAKERGQGFASEVIWQACECPEPAGGAGECDDLVADEDGGGMVERAIDTFETERLRAKDSDHSLQ